MRRLLARIRALVATRRYPRPLALPITPELDAPLGDEWSDRDTAREIRARRRP